MNEVNIWGISKAVFLSKLGNFFGFVYFYFGKAVNLDDSLWKRTEKYCVFLNQMCVGEQISCKECQQQSCFSTPYKSNHLLN